MAGAGSRPCLEELSCIGAALAATWAVPFSLWFPTHCGSLPASNRWGFEGPFLAVATLEATELHRAPSTVALQAGEGCSHQTGHHSHHDAYL